MAERLAAGQEVDVLVVVANIAMGWRPATVLADKGDLGVEVKYPNGDEEVVPMNAVLISPPACEADLG